MKFIMFKRAMIVLNSNYNMFKVSLSIGFIGKSINLDLGFWGISFVYTGEDYA